MSAMWQHIYNWHVQNLPAITGVSAVYDGVPVTGDNPDTYITVGFTGQDGTSGEYQQSYSDNGVSLVEDGHILCHVVSQSGETDPTITRAAAFAAVDAWDNALRRDRTLGGLMQPNNTIWLQVNPFPVQNSEGSAAGLLVTVLYHCETWN